MSKLSLPRPLVAYDIANEAQTRLAIEKADAGNIKSSSIGANDGILQKKDGTVVGRTPAQVLQDLLNSMAEVDVASAATCDIGAATSPKVQITGTAAITSFGTQTDALRFVRFGGALTLTHNATSLILLVGASRTTAAGDVGLYASDDSGNWRELSYLRANGVPLNVSAVTGSGSMVLSAAPTFTGQFIADNFQTGTDGSFLVGTTTNGGWGNAAKLETLQTNGAADSLSGYNSGTASGGSALLLRIDHTAASLANFYASTSKIGSITTNGTSTAFNTSSDARLKNNIADAADAGTIIESLKVRCWDWRSDGSHEAYGFVAQEEYTVAPFAVTAGDDDPTTITQQWSRDDSKLVPLLVKEIQSLRARVATLEAK